METIQILTDCLQDRTRTHRARRFVFDACLVRAKRKLTTRSLPNSSASLFRFWFLEVLIKRYRKRNTKKGSVAGSGGKISSESACCMSICLRRISGGTAQNLRFKTAEMWENKVTHHLSLSLSLIPSTEQESALYNTIFYTTILIHS